MLGGLELSRIEIVIVCLAEDEPVGSPANNGAFNHIRVQNIIVLCNTSSSMSAISERMSEFS